MTNMAWMEHLYTTFYRSLYLYALTFLADEEGAKDVTGSVFQTVWEKTLAGTLQQDVHTVEGFLYTSVRNRCLDTLRHNKAMDRYVRMKSATEPITTDEAAMEFELRVQQVKAAIERLPEPEKTTLTYTYFKKLTYRQTAEKLEMSENMVHKRMNKVFKTLRGMLKNDIP